MVGVDYNLVSKSLSRVIEIMEGQKVINDVGLSVVNIKERGFDIEVEMKILDLPNSSELNEIFLLKPVTADRNQMIELRKPIRSENKATKKMMNREYFRRKK